MKLSVAMCTYNGGAYLREQLESLAWQTRLPDELIVCDDGSRDETRGLLDQFALSAPFPVRLYANEKNLGSTRNFEQSFGLCEGDIIVPADQDDVWHPEKLRRMEAVFASSPEVGLVFTDLEVVDENLRPLGYRAWQCDWVEFDQRAQKLFKKGKALDLLLTRNVVTGCAMAFRSGYRNLIAPTPDGYQGLRIIHDYWIALIIAAVAEVAFINEPLVKYRYHRNQQMGLFPPRPKDPSDWAKKWRRMESYPVLVGLLEAVSERLSSEGHAAKYRAAATELAPRVAHEQVKARLHNEKFISRSASVLKEFFAFRYHRFPHPDANGIYAAAKDMMPYRIRLRDANPKHAPARDSEQRKPGSGDE
jgi:glycosyltransferase involved in cell wall biosynthesis